MLTKGGLTMFEKTVAYYCAPALAGIKPANIVSCHKQKFQDIHREINRLNDSLNSKGIFFRILCECCNRVLLMVYREKKLDRYLQRDDIKGLLNSFGYGERLCLQDKLLLLESRVQQSQFPHEIGAFLGYPVHDIYGFIYHRNEGCLLTGEWKVYQDAETAKAEFKRYNMCRKALLKRLEQGRTLTEVFRAA